MKLNIGVNFFVVFLTTIICGIKTLALQYGQGIFSAQTKSFISKLRLQSSTDEKMDERQTSNDASYGLMNAVPSLKGVKTKIVQLISPSSIEAVQIRHVEVETKEMATFCKSLLTNDSFSFNNEMSTSQSVLWDFASLAANISRCERSRVVGGDLGWVFLDQIEDGNRDDLLVSLAREATVLQKGV